MDDEDLVYWLGKLQSWLPRYQIEFLPKSVKLSVWMPNCDGGPNAVFVDECLHEAVQYFIDSLTDEMLRELKGCGAD